MLYPVKPAGTFFTDEESQHPSFPAADVQNGVRRGKPDPGKDPFQGDIVRGLRARSSQAVFVVAKYAGNIRHQAFPADPLIRYPVRPVQKAAAKSVFQAVHAILDVAEKAFHIPFSRIRPFMRAGAPPSVPGRPPIMGTVYLLFDGYAIRDPVCCPPAAGENNSCLPAYCGI